MTFFEPSNTRIPKCTNVISNPRVAGSSPAAPTNLPNKLPNQSVRPVSELQYSDRPSLNKLIRRDAVARQLEKIESESSPDTKRQWQDYLRLQNFTRKLREAGFSPWVPVGFAAAATVAFGFVLHATPPIKRWHVLERSSDGHRFVIQELRDGAPQQPKVHDYCRDGYIPEFEQGMTLTSYTSVLKGNCESLEGLHYNILRDSSKCPVVPKNCWHNCEVGNHDHNVCNGTPQFD